MVLLAKKMFNANVNRWLKGIIIKYADLLEVWSLVTLQFSLLIVFSVNDWSVSGEPIMICQISWNTALCLSFTPWAWHERKMAAVGKRSFVSYFRKEVMFIRALSLVPSWSYSKCSQSWHRLRIVNGHNGITCGWHTWIVTKCCMVWF